MSAIRLIEFIAFLDLFAIGLIVPLLPAHCRKLGGNHIQVGLLASGYSAFQLISSPVIGSLSDLKGRKPVLICTLLICSVMYTLTGLCTSVVVLICLRAFIGIFKQTQVLTRAMVAEFTTDKLKQSKIYGEIAAIAGIGITLGPVVGGHVVEDYPETGFRNLCMAVGVCFLINTGLIYKYLSPPPALRRHTRRKLSKRDNCQCSGSCSCDECSETVHTSNESKINYLQYIQSNIKDALGQFSSINWSLYWDVFLMKMLLGFAMSMYYSNYAMYLKSVFQLNPKYIGYVVSYQGTVTALASYFMGSINSLYKFDSDFTIRNVHVFLLASMSILGIILSYNLYSYVIWLTPLAIANAVGRLVTLELILQRSKGAHRGLLIGAANSVRSVAGIIAPLTAGFISHYIGINYCVYGSLLSNVLGLCLSFYCRLNRKMKAD